MSAKQAVSLRYAGRFFGTLAASFAQLVRSPSHSRRAACLTDSMPSICVHAPFVIGVPSREIE